MSPSFHADKVCRLCLRQDSILYDIFDIGEMKEKISSYMSIQVLQNDPLPKKICVVCVQKVNSWHAFRNHCQEMQRLLTSNNVDENSRENSMEFTDLVHVDEVSKRGRKEEEQSEMYDSDQESDDSSRMSTASDASSRMSCTSEAYYNVVFKDTAKEEIDESDLTIDHSDSTTIDLVFTNTYGNYIDMIMRLSCDICRHLFTTKPMIMAHLRKKHEKIPLWACFYCCVRFDNRSLFMQHYSSKGCLARRKRLDACKSYVCEVCWHESRSIFDFRIHIAKHMTTSIGGRAHCTWCQVTFDNSDELLAHARTGNCYFAISCGCCGYNFSSDIEYIMHKCKQTDRTNLPDPPKMKNMIRRMPSKKIKKKPTAVVKPTTAVSSTVCNICSRSFNDTRVFKRHMFRHKYKKADNIHCENCSATFANTRMLDLHEYFNHTKKPQKKIKYDGVTCLYCYKEFSSKYSLIGHLRHTHSVTFTNMITRFRVKIRT